MSALPKSTHLDAVVQRYYRPLLSFFRKRTHNTADTQDLVQQVFLRLAQNSEQTAIENPDAYIFQTASNTLKDHYRRNSVRDRFANILLEDSGTTYDSRSDLSPERVLQAREEVSLVAAALRQLPERTRDIFMLRCFEGLKHAEIARLQGLSVRAVEKHFAKALVTLSAAIEPDVETPP